MSQFPTRAPHDLHPADVVPYLLEMESQGWSIFTEPDGFSFDTEAERVHLSFNESHHTCTFRGSDEAGLSFLGATVGSIPAFETNLRRFTGSPPPATRATMRRGDPAHNLIRVATMIRNAKATVEGVYDSWLNNEGMRTFSTLVRLSEAVSPDVRLLTSRRGAKGLNPQFAIQLLHELGCPQGEIRQMAITGHEGRFLLLSGGRTLRMGMSLNRLDTNDTAHLDEGDAEARALFQSAWDSADPI